MFFIYKSDYIHVYENYYLHFLILYNELQLYVKGVNSTISNKVDQQYKSFKKGKTNKNIFSEVQMSQNNDYIKIVSLWPIEKTINKLIQILKIYTHNKLALFI